MSDDDLVFSGTVSMPTASGSTPLTINFDEPFAYNGYSAVAVTVVDNSSDYASFHYFYGDKSTTNNRSLYKHSDNTSYSIGALPSGPTASKFRPAVRFSGYNYTEPPTGHDVVWDWGDTISYITDDAEPVYVGLSSGKWGIRIPASELQGRNYLTDVQLYVGAPTSYTLNVYQGITPGATPKYSYLSVFTASDTGAWQTITLPGGMSINQAQDLWVTFTMPQGGRVAETSTYLGDTNGSMYISNAGKWRSGINLYLHEKFSWMIRAVTSATAPAIPTPVTSIAAYSKSLVGKDVTFQAVGGSNYTYSWSFPGAVTTTATGQSASAKWLTPGTYTVTVTASFGGQTATASHSILVFECGNDMLLPYSDYFNQGGFCWTNVNADNDNYTWTIEDGAARYIAPVSEDNPDDWLISPPILLNGSGSITLEWLEGSYYADNKYAVKLSTTGDDPDDFTVTLFDGGALGDSFWDERTVDISPYATQTVRIAFYFYESHYDAISAEYGATNYFYIDDVTITADSYLPTEIEASISGPATATVNMPVTLTAVGTEGGSYSWDLGGAMPATATGSSVTAVWLSAGTYTVTLTATIGALTATATHTIVVSAGSTPDEVSISGPAAASVGTPVAFSAVGPAMGTYVWSFPDGDPVAATGQSATTTWNAAGTYTVTLTAIVDGQAQTLTHSITITAASTVSIVGPGTAAPGQTVAFAAAGPADATYVWSFPGADPAAATGQAVTTRWDAAGTYTVTLTAIVGGQPLTATHTIVVETNAIGDVDAVQVTLVPNPTTGLVRVQRSGRVERLELYSLQGTLLLAADGADAVDLGTLPAGTYLLRVVTPEGSAVQRVVKH